jgi:N-acetyl-anhydromuramyl-L-alanine amidase AmpD
LKPVGNEAHDARARIAELEAEKKALLTESARLHGLVENLAGEGAETPEWVQDVTDSLPQNESESYALRTLEQIRDLIIHHTAVSPDVGPEIIARYHVRSKGWPAIGYHFLVMSDGTVFQTNRLRSISYHARQANASSVGIAFAGNLMGIEPTAAQLRSGGRLLAYLMRKLELHEDSVKGHKDFVPTSCPGNQWDRGSNWHDRLLGEAKRAADLIA